ncbi:MAG: hypothetical protein IJ091_05660 [Oscillospiraceae bacterium]|nr:hypothetical protein [Oscillospiraceae bacterium]
MIRLADIFTNGMTLQREKEIRIWGTTDVAQTVEVTLNGRSILEGEKIEGEFTLVLPPQDAEENAVLSIIGTDIVELTNVDIGEVWVAGGQSNMEFLLRYDREAKDQISQAHDPHFRFFRCR